MNLSDDQPARRVVSRSPVRTVRILNMPRLFSKPIECESSLERDFVYRAVLCPSVAHIRHQPFQLKLAGRKYTPDFLIRHVDGSHTAVEVKLSTNVEKYRDIFDLAAYELQTKSCSFLVADEASIREKKTHARAALILRYRKASIDPRTRFVVLEYMARHADGLPISELIQRCGASFEDILQLLADRHLSLEQGLNLSPEALVFPSGKKTQNEYRIENWFGLALWPTNA